MTLKKNNFIFLVFFSLLFINNGYAQTKPSEQHIKVAMRMVGHELLLQSGDSTSRVLPITKIDNQYKISVDTDFKFDPSDLVETIGEVMTTAEITNDYLVEINKCGQDDVLYSYEINNKKAEDLIPCGGRVLPKACYIIIITILNPDASIIQKAASYKSNLLNSNSLVYITISIIGILMILGWFWNRKTQIQTKSQTQNRPNPNIILIGEYQFDKQKMTLFFNNSITELTSKETDLLLFLYKNANETLEREQILKEVWGDEGDYIGRTLDVFISKLRKRLGGDPVVKILNIRGVGYKLVTDVMEVEEDMMK